MKNLRNIFKEYQSDPKVFRNLRIGFAALVVLGILLLFAVSPSVRHIIGIGGNHALPSHTENPKRHHHRKVRPHAKQKQSAKRILHHPTKAHKHGSKHNALPVRHQGSEVIHTPEGSTPPTHTLPHHPHHHEAEAPQESGHGNSGSTPQPAPDSPPSSQPSTPAETPSKGSEEEPSGNGESTTPPPQEEKPPPVKVEVTPPKLGVELNVPPITNTPPVEEVVGTVNETVHGVTSTVEEIFNGLGTPVHVELPELCLVNC